MKLIPIPSNCIRPDEVAPSLLVDEMLSTYTTYYPTIGFNPPWIGYFIVEDDHAAGTCGFTGAPKDNRVELAYYTFKENEGRGIATFGCRELIRMGKEADPDVIVFAKTAPEENASTSILRKNGFRKGAVVQDHEIGDAWEWIHSDAGS